MKRKIRAILIMMVFACVVVGVYYIMNNRETGDSETVDIPETKVEKLLAKDLDTEYPATVKTVMNLYSQYSKCFYDGEYKDDELPKLLDKYRQLLDPELLANNPVEDQLKSLNEEIESFGGKGKIIIAYYWPSERSSDKEASPKPTSSSEKEDVTYYTKDGVNYATTTLAYTIKQGTEAVLESKEKFILRQDSDKKWKILGWELVNEKQNKK